MTNHGVRTILVRFSFHYEIKITGATTTSSKVNIKIYNPGPFTRRLERLKGNVWITGSGTPSSIC